MAADALVALGVVVGGGIIFLTGWFWLDPVISLAVSVVIVTGTWSLLRDSVLLSLDAVPPGIDRDGVEKYLRSLPGVAREQGSPYLGHEHDRDRTDCSSHPSKCADRRRLPSS
jgi:Co/Zn/Cd efflux system component